MIRCFEDDNVIHVAGKVDPKADMDVINLELALADLSQIEKRVERLAKGRAKEKSEVEQQEQEKAALARISAALNDGKGARSVALTEEEKELVKGLCLLTLKPIIYAANVAEGDLADQASVLFCRLLTLAAATRPACALCVRVGSAAASERAITPRDHPSRQGAKNKYVKMLREAAAAEGASVVVVSAQARRAGSLLAAHCAAPAAPLLSSPLRPRT